MNTVSWELRLFARHAGLRQAVSLVLAASFTAGCMRWEPVLDAARYVPAKRPSLMRVTLANHEQIELYHPTFIDGQLVNHSATPISIPVQDIASAKALSHDDRGTAILTTAIIIGVVGSIFALRAWCERNCNFGGGIGGWSR